MNGVSIPDPNSPAIVRNQRGNHVRFHIETVPSPRALTLRLISRLRAMLAVLALLPLLAACGSAGSDAEPTAESATVDDILASASTRIADTQAMRFGLAVEGDTFIDTTQTIRLLAARGQLARPDSVQVDFQASLFGAGSVSIRMISIGQNAWTTDLLTGNWGVAPVEFGYNPTVLYDNQNGLGPVMGRIENPQALGTEDVRGRTAHRIGGTASAETIALVTSGTMTGSAIAMELWIDAETSDLLRVRLAEPEDSGKAEPAVWTMDLTDHGQQVAIEPPI